MSMEHSQQEIVDTFVVSQFLYKEARFLDRRQYADWQALWDASTCYRVYFRTMRDLTAGEKSVAIIDDDAIMMAARIAQISSPNLTKAENPPSLTRRLIGNIEIIERFPDDIVVVLSNIFVTRVRGTSIEGTLYSASRTDRIRMREGNLRLVEREVVLDQTLLFNGALTTLL